MTQNINKLDLTLKGREANFEVFFVCKVATTVTTTLHYTIMY